MCFGGNKTIIPNLSAYSTKAIHTLVWHQTSSPAHPMLSDISPTYIREIKKEQFEPLSESVYQTPIPLSLFTGRGPTPRQQIPHFSHGADNCCRPDFASSNTLPRHRQTIALCSLGPHVYEVSSAEVTPRQLFPFIFVDPWDMRSSTGRAPLLDELLFTRFVSPTHPHTWSSGFVYP